MEDCRFYWLWGRMLQCYESITHMQLGDPILLTALIFNTSCIIPLFIKKTYYVILAPMKHCKRRNDKVKALALANYPMFKSFKRKSPWVPLCH